MSDHVTTDDEISAGLAEAVEEGLVSRRLGPDGEWLYSMTDAGSAYVESMPDHPQDGTAGAGVPDTREEAIRRHRMERLAALRTPTDPADLIADDDLDSVREMLDQGAGLDIALYEHAPQWRARWVAEALRQAALSWPLASDEAVRLHGLAAEYRDGKR